MNSEWWIEDRWTVSFADGDHNHESLVVDRAIDLLLDEMAENPQTKDIRRCLLESYDGDIHAFREDMLNATDRLGVDRYMDWLRSCGIDYWVIDRATNMNQDHRIVGMRDYGWSAVRGDRVDTWALTTRKRKDIGGGLWEIAELEGFEQLDTEFTIEDFSTRKLFRATADELCSGVVSPYGSCQPISSL